MLSLVVSSPSAAQISPGPLARAHASLEGAVNCVKCHGLRGAGSGSGMTSLCLQCHKEIAWLMQQQRGLHSREVRVGRKECASCHPDHAGADFRLVEWAEGAPSRFDHRRAGWPLEGKHGEVRCESCHTVKFRTGTAFMLSSRKSGAGWVGLERNCVACHKGDDSHDGALGPTCSSCHDANGWNKAPGFDHDSADYRLDGKHTGVACDKCHLTPRLKARTNARGERIPLFKPVAHKECSSCHADPHQGRFSANCSECHETRGFDRVDKGDFNHSVTRFPLKGAHANASCAKCHGKDMARKAPAFESCAACHADAHRGEATLGGKATDCASCHRVDSFAPSTFTVAQHRTTSYPLDGKHASVKCSACHVARSATDGAAGAIESERGRTMLVPSVRVVRLRPSAAHCADCHEEVHGGQLAGRVPAATCESCHAVDGFSPSTFGARGHARLRLPLEGKHLAIPCVSCHGATRVGLPPWPSTFSLGKARVALTGLDPKCASCHVDPHGGRYGTPGGAAGDGTCRACHGADTFRPSRVDVAMHASFSMALDGAHRAVPCVACHAEMSKGSWSSTMVGAAVRTTSLPFATSPPRTCTSCHETPHGQQFAGRGDGGDCAACHSLDAFAPARRFNHDATRFSLKGAHAGVACVRCHTREPIAGAPPGATRVIYRPLSPACESCHAPRPGQRSR